jgi:hypothetical protein
VVGGDVRHPLLDALHQERHDFAAGVEDGLH